LHKLTALDVPVHKVSTIVAQHPKTVYIKRVKGTQPTMNTLAPNPQLDMLMSREQLMEDIDAICDEFFYNNYNGDTSEAQELVRVLCDAVCKNFPTN